jgi:hypothetical protein
MMLVGYCTNVARPIVGDNVPVPRWYCSRVCVLKEDSVSHNCRKSLRVDTQTPITKENGVVPNGCHRGSPSQDKVS